MYSSLAFFRSFFTIKSQIYYAKPREGGGMCIVRRARLLFTGPRISGDRDGDEVTRGRYRLYPLFYQRRRDGGCGVLSVVKALLFASRNSYRKLLPPPPPPPPDTANSALKTVGFFFSTSPSLPSHPKIPFRPFPSSKIPFSLRPSSRSPKNVLAADPGRHRNS